MSGDVTARTKPMSADSDPIGVSFIGAGPGAADLLTLRAVERIARADLLVYAGSLIPKAVLAHASAQVRKVSSAGKRLEDFVPLMIQTCRQGGRVARLHSGDPSVFSAMGEQMDRLRAAGIGIEIVPGVPAFAAVAARAGMELTRPGLAQTVVLTRPGRAGSAMPEDAHLEGLSVDKSAVLCLHLAGHSLEANLETLCKLYGEETMALLAARVTWPDEILWTHPLGVLLRRAPELEKRSAVMIVVNPRQGGERSALYAKAGGRGDVDD